ncbi:MAG: hypothetical protein QOF51_4116 [Chloroflexota bacterium]|jgi:predicted ester cyclase|nr:hypothetical protein [Chloroflexota bacterium]
MSAEANLARNSTADDLHAFILRVYAEFDRRRADALNEFVAENVQAHFPAMPQTLDKDGFKQAAMLFYTAFPDGHHAFDEVVVEGHTVVTRGVWQGTHGGDFLGIAPTGKPVTIGVLHLDRVIDGQIVEHWGQADIMALLLQIGVNPLA